MASIYPRTDSKGNISFQIKVSRGRGIKPFTTTYPQKGFTIPKTWSKKTLEKKVKEYATEFEMACRQGHIATEKKTFSEYADYVISMKEERNQIKPKTAARYREFLKRINNTDLNGIGYMKLEDIRAEHLNKFYSTLSKPHKGKTLAPKTVLEHHRLISMILTQADKEMLVYRNVAEISTPPKVPRKEAEHYDIDLVSRVLEAVDMEPLKWQAFMSVLIGSGARLGEVIGLQWSNVDFETNQIYICNNVQYLPGKGIYATSTKTNENRYVALPETVMQKFKEWKAEQMRINAALHPSVIKLNGYCFTQADGLTPMHPNSVKCFLTRLSKKHNLPHLHPHGFRHTQASLLINSGEDILTISKRLGHKKTSTTMDIYGHLLAKADKQSASTIDNLLFKKA